MHPQVEVFWNFFPFDFFNWWIVKMFWNCVFFLFWIPSIPFYEAWNFIPYVVLPFAWMGFGFLAVFWMFAWMADLFVFCCWSYLYMTSMPISTPIMWMLLFSFGVLFVMFVIGGGVGALAGIIVGIVEGTK